MTTPIQIVFDANDPALLAEFWALVLGYVVQPPPDGFTSWAEWATAMGIPEENRNDASAVVDPEGHGPRIYFQRVPEGKTAKNRLHLDVNAGGGHDVPIANRRAAVDAEVARLVEAGASTVGPVEQRGEYWVVLADPEGNEFCVQ